MKPLPPQTYLTRPLSELLALPALTPMAHRLQHDAWVLAFAQALEKGGSLPQQRGKDVRSTMVSTIHANDLMRIYNTQVAQPLDQTAPVEAMIQHLDRIRADPAVEWSLTDTGFCDLLRLSLHTYRGQRLILPVIEHWLKQGPTEPLARILFEDREFDLENGEVATLGQTVRALLETGTPEQEARVRRAWEFFDPYAKAPLLLTWAQQGLSPALDALWADDHARLQGWSEGLAYALFNDGSPRAIGALWSRVEKTGQPVVLDTLEKWLYAYPMEGDENEEPEATIDLHRVRTLIQLVEPLRDIIPVAFWQGVPSVRAHVRHVELGQRPAAPFRRPRSRA